MTDDTTLTSDPAGMTAAESAHGEPRATSILFVCLGNICRSPLAEGVASHLVMERGLSDRITVDSAGTGAWHTGELPDSRSIEVAARHGITLSGRARQLRGEDLFRFDLVIAMDRSNLERLNAVRDRNGGTASLHLLRDFDSDPGDGEVPDPYYGGARGFDEVFTLVERSIEGLLDALEAGTT